MKYKLDPLSPFGISPEVETNETMLMTGGVSQSELDLLQSKTVPETGGMPIHQENMSDWYAKLENINSEPIDILVMTDSIGETGTDDGTQQPWPWQVESLFNRYTQENPPVGYVRITNAAGFGPIFDSVTNATLNSAGFGQRAALITTGGVATHTASCDRISVLYRVSASGGSIEVRDGVTLLTTISASGTDTPSSMWTSDDLGLATRTITLTVVGGSGTYIEGVYFYQDNYDKGVRVWPACRAGALSSNITSSLYYCQNFINNSGIVPDLALYCTGVNDGGATNYNTYMRDSITAIKALLPNATHALYIPYILPSSDRWLHDPHVLTARQIASDYSMPTIDMSILAPDFSVSNAELKHDSTHPTHSGTVRLARMAFTALSPDPIGNTITLADEALKKPLVGTDGTAGTDGGLVVFDGETATQTKMSGVSVDSSDNLDVPGDLAVVDVNASGNVTTEGLNVYGGSSGRVQIGKLFGYPLIAMFGDEADTEIEFAFINSALAAVLGFSSAIIVFGPGGSTTFDSFISREGVAHLAVRASTTTFGDLSVNDLNAGTTAGGGVVLTSPDGTRWRVTIDNEGSLTSTEI